MFIHMLGLYMGGVERVNSHTKVVLNFVSLASETLNKMEALLPLHICNIMCSTYHVPPHKPIMQCILLVLNTENNGNRTGPYCNIVSRVVHPLDNHCHKGMRLVLCSLVDEDYTQISVNTY